MATDDGAFKTEMIQRCYGIVRKHFRAVFGRRFTGQTRAAIIEDHDTVVTREFRNLVQTPYRAVAGGLAEKNKRCALSGRFVIDFYPIFRFDVWHDLLSLLSILNKPEVRSVTSDPLRQIRVSSMSC